MVFAVVGSFLTEIDEVRCDTDMYFCVGVLSKYYIYTLLYFSMISVLPLILDVINRDLYSLSVGH